MRNINPSENPYIGIKKSDFKNIHNLSHLDNTSEKINMDEPIYAYVS